jgi:anti-sigma regulatory factor (Ser/Thr protein kinase)
MRTREGKKIAPAAVESLPEQIRIALQARRSDPLIVSDIELLTTKLVTNAVKHAKMSQSEQIIVRLELRDGVRVEVIDPGPPFDPRPIKPDPGSPHGWA